MARYRSEWKKRLLLWQALSIIINYKLNLFFLWNDKKIGLTYMVKCFSWHCQDINLNPGVVTQWLLFFSHWSWKPSKLSKLLKWTAFAFGSEKRLQLKRNFICNTWTGKFSWPPGRPSRGGAFSKKSIDTLVIFTRPRFLARHSDAPFRSRSTDRKALPSGPSSPWRESAAPSSPLPRTPS